MFGLSVFAAPTSEPVSISEAKDHLRVTSADEDGLIAGYLLAARTMIERVTNLSLVPSTFDLTLDDFPAGRYPDGSTIYLPRGPVISVTSVTYFDQSGTQQTLAGSEYTLDASRIPARVCVAPNRTWPSVQNRINAITVRFVAGYPVGSAPEPVRHAILLLVGHFYQNREAVSLSGAPVTFPMSVDALIEPYRLRWMA